MVSKIPPKKERKIVIILARSCHSAEPEEPSTMALSITYMRKVAHVIYTKVSHPLVKMAAVASVRSERAFLARTIIDYLRLSRAHTAALPMSFVLLGYLLAGGPLLGLGTIKWLAFGLVFTCAGFIDNNIRDYTSDLQDSNKDSFPLGRSVKLRDARAFLLVLQLSGIVIAFFFSGSFLGFGIFVAMFVSGLLYNRKNKTSSYAGPILISLTFGPLALFSFVSTLQTVNFTILAVTALAFIESLWMGIFGNIKDVVADRTSPVKKLGIRVHDGFLSIPRRTRLFAMLLKISGAIPIVALLIVLPDPLISIYYCIFLSVLLGLTFWVTYLAVRPATWKLRTSFMRNAAMSEIGMYYALIVVLSSQQLGLVSAFFLGCFPPLWYAILTRALWGKFLAQVS